MASFILHDWCVLGLWTLKCFVRGGECWKAWAWVALSAALFQKYYRVFINLFLFKTGSGRQKGLLWKLWFTFSDSAVQHQPWLGITVSAVVSLSELSVCKRWVFFWKQDFWFCIYLQAKETVLCYDYINAICWSCVWCFRGLFKEWFFVSLEAMHINIEISFFFFRLKHCPSIKLSC